MGRFLGSDRHAIGKGFACYIVRPLCCAADPSSLVKIETLIYMTDDNGHIYQNERRGSFYSWLALTVVVVRGLILLGYKHCVGSKRV